jgi:subtilisin family serine protease
MTTGRWFFRCEHVGAHRWTRSVPRRALPTLAIVAATSMCGAGIAQAFFAGSFGGFRPPSIRIQAPRIGVNPGLNNIGGTAATATAASAAAAAGAASYIRGTHDNGTKNPDHFTRRRCGTNTRFRFERVEEGCDLPPKHNIARGNDDGDVPKHKIVRGNDDGDLPKHKDGDLPKHKIVRGNDDGDVPTRRHVRAIDNDDDVVVSKKRHARGGPIDNGPSNTRPSIAGPSGPGRSGVPAADERRYVPNEVVVELSGNPTEQTFDTLGARYRLDRIETQRIGLTNSTFVRWRIADRRSVSTVIRAIEGDNTVRNTVLSAQPNYLFAQQQAAEVEKAEPKDESIEAQPAAPAGDPAQYALAKLHLPEAQAFGRGDSVVVAVIDTEIDAAHPELAGAITGSYDALGVASANGKETHGTGIAGTIAAHAKLLGAAPNVRILAIRAFGAGVGTTFTIIKGLDYAVAHDARVINMSFAGPTDPALTRALGAAHAKGRILIAAVGNKGAKSPPLFPAADPNVIGVTATDAKDRLFEGSNRGDQVAIAAPGVDIYVPAPGNLYKFETGTSFASAYVAGVAALLAERKPDITPDAVKNILMSTAHHLGPTARDAQFGAGLMDAQQAITSINGRPAAELTAGAGH